MNRRRGAGVTAGALAGAALAFLCAGAFPQNYPVKPVRGIVAFAAGGQSDVVARIVAQKLSERWNQPLVIDNRAGANGSLAMEACSRSAPDGYTVCFTDGNIMTLNPYAYSKLPYDPREFVPVIHFAELEQAILVTASVPVKSVRELVEYAKARPGQVTWGSSGAGSSMHLYLEWIQIKTGARFNHILYKGPAPLVQAIVAGEVQATSLTTGTAAPFIKAGKIKSIAVITGQRRSPFAGDGSTFAEQGFDLDFRNWLALCFPKGTPPELARRWNEEMNKLLADRAFVEKITSSESFTLTGGTPEDMAAIMERKLKIGAELARITHLKYD